jgi:hypothetical protein
MDLVFDADVRVDKIIWIAGISAKHNDDFEELIEDGDLEDAAKVMGLDFKALTIELDIDPEDDNGPLRCCNCSWREFIAAKFESEQAEEKAIRNRIVKG